MRERLVRKRILKVVPAVLIEPAMTSEIAAKKFASDLCESLIVHVSGSHRAATSTSADDLLG